MAYCINCGAELIAGARFCSYCGTQVAAAPAATVPVTPVAPAPTMAVPTMTVPSTPVRKIPTAHTMASAINDDNVLLVSLGACTMGVAVDLLRDLCGYTLTDARAIVHNTPITIAQMLSTEQSTLLAQALSEFGMEVCIYDRSGYRTVTSTYDSVFDVGGNMLLQVAKVLGLIGAANRLPRTMIRRQTFPFAFTGMLPPIYRHPRTPRRTLTPRRYYIRGTAPAPRPVGPRSRVLRPAGPRAAVGVTRVKRLPRGVFVRTPASPIVPGPLTGPQGGPARPTRSVTRTAVVRPAVRPAPQGGPQGGPMQPSKGPAPRPMGVPGGRRGPGGGNRGGGFQR